jgi:hypothetical protein
MEKETKSTVEKKRMLMLDAFEDHLTLDARCMIHAMNTDYVIIPDRMTS